MLDRLTLDQLRTFATIAECGSFRAAAARLSRVQSAISQAVANLETELGVPLFDRSGHRPLLTPEGRALLANANDILLRVDVMRAQAHGLAAGAEPEFGVSVDTLFPLSAATHALKVIAKAYPHARLRLAVEPLGGPVKALLDGRSTAAVIVGEDFQEPRISREAIGTVRQVAVVSSDHPLARNDAGPVGPPELAEYIQIVLSDPSPLSEGRSFGVISNKICLVNTQDAKHAMILSGLGWGRLPSWLVASDLRERRLVRIPTRLLGANSEIVSEAYLAHRMDKPFGPVARAFQTALVASLHSEADSESG